MLSRSDYPLFPKVKSPLLSSDIPSNENFSTFNEPQTLDKRYPLNSAVEDLSLQCSKPNSFAEAYLFKTIEVAEGEIISSLAESQSASTLFQSQVGISINDIERDAADRRVEIFAPKPKRVRIDDSIHQEAQDPQESGESQQQKRDSDLHASYFVNLSLGTNPLVFSSFLAI